MLEDIDELWVSLEDYDVDLLRIPKVYQDSPTADVAQVQKILRMKYDRRRYTTFGTEFILAGVHGLEYLFDGKRKWGPYQPDLTNWHNTVRTKLRRMRYETSMIVSDVMHQWNVGAFTRVLIELVPSAFLHSRMRSEQHGKAGYTPDQISAAYDALPPIRNRLRGCFLRKTQKLIFLFFKQTCPINVGFLAHGYMESLRNLWKIKIYQISSYRADTAQ